MNIAESCCRVPDEGRQNKPGVNKKEAELGTMLVRYPNMSANAVFIPVQRFDNITCNRSSRLSLQSLG
ncbi:hypothetical protein QG37_01048 [Candidozyma auris]|nr:hypothetical protein QG37_01048 [[Candida] auris]